MLFPAVQDFPRFIYPIIRMNKFAYILPYIMPPPQSVGQDLQTTLRYRFLFIVGFVVFCYIAIFVRLVQVTVFPEKYAVSRSPSDIVGNRGRIYDRNGVLVADTVPTRGVYVNPKKVRNPEQLAKQLIAVFPDISYESMYKKVTRNARFVWIKRVTTPTQQYATNAIGDVALEFEKSYMRIYPQTHLMSHVVGYANIDGQGLSGIEHAMDSRLRHDKQDVYITLDSNVQHIVRSEILNVMKATNAEGGVGIVMDVNTGEILALSSLPDFNPNTHKNTNTFNRATVGVYELGSTFKILNSALALESGLITISDTFDARKPLRLGRFLIRDYHAKNRIMDVAEIFIHSSNIGSALMAQKVGVQAQRAFMERLGLLKRMDIILTETSVPLIPKRWNKTENVTIAYGHGISVSPLHLSTAVASVVNGGEYVRPRFIKTKTETPLLTHRVVSKNTSLLVRKLMRLNTLDGSGKKSAVQGYVVGGKTGTADKINRTGGYDGSALISSYVAVFPMHAPKYLVYVMVDSPKPSDFTRMARPTGGLVAAPTVGVIINRIAPLLKVRPVDEKSAPVQSLKIKTYEKRKKLRESVL